MKCSRCDTELPDATTYCPSCGILLRSDSSPGAPAVFSYLPAEAPPWPTTVPQNLFKTGTAAQTVDATESSQAIKPRRSARSIMQIIGVLLLIPLIGVLSTLGTLYAQGQLFAGSGGTTQKSSTKLNTSVATPTPTAAPQTNVLPAPTSFKKTSNQDVNVSLQYPSDWIAEAPQKSTSVTIVDFHPSQQQFGIDFEIAHLNDSMTAQFPDADAINLTLLNNMSNSQGINNLHGVPTATPQPTVGGSQWTQRDALYTDSNGKNIRFTTLSVQHNSTYYNIIFSSPDAYYNEAVQKYVQPILDSIQFLS